MVDYAFLNFIALVGIAVATILFRKRIITAVTDRFLLHGAEAFDSLLFEEVFAEIDGEKVKQKVLTPYARNLMGQSAPILISEGLKAIKLKIPQHLPVNAAGELDFMAPVIQKMAAGKKVKIEDFLPVIMDKAMPYIEGFLGNLGKGVVAQSTSPMGETKNPFL